MNKRKYTHFDGQPLRYEGQNAVKFMFDPEVHKRALKDPDAPPVKEEQFKEFKRVNYFAKKKYGK